MLGQKTKAMLGSGAMNRDWTELLSCIGKWQREGEEGPCSLGSHSIRATRFQGAGDFQKRVRQGTMSTDSQPRHGLLLGSGWEQLVVSAYWLSWLKPSTSLSGLI